MPRPVDQSRLRVSYPFIRGEGVEIGAGAYPQPLPEGCKCKYFDTRTKDDLQVLFKTEIAYPVSSVDSINTDFPQGADFLIAHHVLEHSSDPIGLLTKFHSHVRDGGTVVVSLPHQDFCPDAGRLPPGIEHLILDHLLGRGDEAFESREHIYSFLLGWINDTPTLTGLNQRDTAKYLFSEARRDGHDLHWHTFETVLSTKLVYVSCLLSGRGAQLLALADPFSSQPTVGEIILVYQLLGSGSSITGFPADPQPELARLREKLAHALHRLDNRETT